jgi:hypothetical protein
MDFLHGPPAAEKRQLWQQGIQRVASQHPYAGLLVASHATYLYQADLSYLPSAEKAATQIFLAQQVAFISAVRATWQTSPTWRAATSDAAVEANTRLLQFGDSASLQLAVPWGDERRFSHCPVDQRGAYTAITMNVIAGERLVTFDPWPFDVTDFTVRIHGRYLAQRTFPDLRAYHATLNAAPQYELSWRIVKRP